MSRGVVVVVVNNAATKSAIRRGGIAGAAATVLPSTMERLHGLSTNAYDHVEHVYSPSPHACFRV